MLPEMSFEFHWPDFLATFAREAKARGFTCRTLAELPGGPLCAWEKPADSRHRRPACIYLSAGIHGDEPAGPLALLHLLEENFFTAGTHWLLCPALNPDGLAANHRENARGLDLNRDYWLRSTPEVAAHTAWIESVAVPDLFISLHEDWETAGFYFYEINLGADVPARAKSILDAASPWFPAEPGPEIDGHETRSSGWIYHRPEADVPEGWPEAIFMAKRGCPLSFTFETPSRSALEPRVRSLAAAAVQACRSVTTAPLSSPR